MNISERELAGRGNDKEETRGLERLEEVCEGKGEYITVSVFGKLLGIRPLDIYKMIKRDTITAAIIDHRILIAVPWCDK